jgi:hypothetical protein
MDGIDHSASSATAMCRRYFLDKLISFKKAPILDRALIARDAAHIAALARDHPAVPSPS